MKLQSYAIIIIFTNFFFHIKNFQFNNNDDLIIKFNVENPKFKNPEYVHQVKKKLRKEMSLIKKNIEGKGNPLIITRKNKFSEDIDLDDNVKIYEKEQKTNSGNYKDNSGDNSDKDKDDDDSYINDFEEKDLIKSIIYLTKSIFYNY
jgi:hypothetical protein